MAVPSRDNGKDGIELETMESTTSLKISPKRRGGRNAPGGPPGNKKALKHGFYSYKAMLDGDGLDERTSLFKDLDLAKEKGRQKCPWRSSRQQESAQARLLLLQSDARRRRFRRENVAIQSS